LFFFFNLDPTVPDHIMLPSTLRKILSNNIDFRAVPRKVHFICCFWMVNKLS